MRLPEDNLREPTDSRDVVLAGDEGLDRCSSNRSSRSRPGKPSRHLSHGCGGSGLILGSIPGQLFCYDFASKTSQTMVKQERTPKKQG